LIYNVLPGSFPELSAPKKAYMNFFHQVVAKKAKKIIVVSNSTKKDFIRLYKAPAEKIHVIPLAVNDEFRPAVNEDEIKKKLIQHGIRKKYFLFVGERRPHKNIVRMIEAFKRFRERSSNDYQFVIVGKNYSNYSAPEEKIKVLSLERDVILTDYVSDETLKLYYQGAEALVFASLYEGFGIPILEAMSCGVLVITSNVSSMPEVAGDAAILVDPKNSDQISREMERVVTNSELKNDLVVKGLRRARQFSWKKTAERTLSIYEEIYANGSGRN
jgi:glycosyltransferase involved in cell wall biosynthesis